MEATLGIDQRGAEIADFLQKNGWSGAERSLLAADASFRRYDRVWRDGQSAVLMDAPPPREDVRPFLRIARHLDRLGYSAPRILAEDTRLGLLLLEDLGDATFTRLLQQGVAELELYELATDLLIDLHQRPAPDGLPAYDLDRFLAEVMLLPDWYAPAIGRTLSDQARADYQSRWRAVLPLVDLLPKVLVLRDFHVDNLMRIEGRSGLARCGLLDFQDALFGPSLYDLVSLLEDARRDVGESVAAAMRARYLAYFPAIARGHFDQGWACLAAQRHAKVIGIFTRLAHRDGKPGYLRHVARVVRLLQQALTDPAMAPVADWFAEHLPLAQMVTPPPRAPI